MKGFNGGLVRIEGQSLGSRVRSQEVELQALGVIRNPQPTTPNPSTARRLSGARSGRQPCKTLGAAFQAKGAAVGV